MNFDINKTIDILQRTPLVLEFLLKDISDDLAFNNEGHNTFSPFDVIGHLIHGEKTDWIPRMEIILSDHLDKTFEPYDRFAQFKESEGKTINQLLVEFKIFREKNIELLKSMNFTDTDFLKIGIHPSLGVVTLQELIATWVVHDLNHIAQITRVMSKNYKHEVGPWIDYLPILTKH